MKHVTRKTRWLLIAAVMLAATAALAFSDGQSVCAFGFCKPCEEQCWNEANHVMNQCLFNGKSFNECADTGRHYYTNCTAFFCPTCPVRPNPFPL